MEVIVGVCVKVGFGVNVGLGVDVGVLVSGTEVAVGEMAAGLQPDNETLHIRQMVIAILAKDVFLNINHTSFCSSIEIPHRS